ncbi:PAS domain-containing sensor histidine kinase [Hymenobacter psoromatis]|uniref:PAS domain-containing sensor histidine kinase n=1 Tax=Hymenobacter psoromatis TaxID=1484116 RepID=UPI001CC0B619|nr:sensor histidine kinase [Hymenobacter psoromatis]
MTPNPQEALRALRQRAERRRLVSESLPPTTAPEVQRLVQELQVHQIELEMQYEELLLAQTDAESSRQQYVELYDFAPVGYCTLSAAGTVQQLNLHTSQLLGQERLRLRGRRLALFVVPAERDRFAEFLARLWAAPGRHQSCELTMRRADETTFFAQLEGVATAESDDETLPPTSYRLVLLDVTARRRAADALAASEVRFRATFEQARDGMVLLDGDCFVDLNAAALRLLGRPDKSQVLGRCLLDFWPDTQPAGRPTADVLAQSLHVAQAQGWCRLELLRHDPAGEACWDELSFNPVLIAGRSLLHAAWRDITARKKGEQQLRESESRLQLALAAADTGVWGWEQDGGQLYQDARAREIFGLAEEPAAAAGPFGQLQAALHPNDQARVAQALNVARHEQAIFDVECRLLGAAGNVRHVAALGRFSYEEPSGQPLRFTGLVRDVTTQYAVKEELGSKNRLLDNILQHLPVVLSRQGLDGRYREQIGQGLHRLGMTDNCMRGQLAAEVLPSLAPHFQRLLAGERQSYVASLEHAGRPVYFQCCGFFDHEKQEAVVFAIDITDSERLKEEATHLRLRQQQEVLSAILTTQEEERRRIAEALHNGVGQLLYATRLHLDALPPSEAVHAGKELLNEAIRATRSISFELTPSILEDFGLAVALQELVSRIPASLAVDLNLRGLDQPLPALLATAVYRIVQELVNNVMKHAQAQEVFVEVSREDHQVYISVEDDGVGFDAGGAAARTGIGLAGIRTRLGLLGGTFSSQSRPGQGTSFLLQLPVPAELAKGD